MRLVAEPKSDIFRKKRNQDLIYPCIVGIQPSKLICREQLRNDSSRIEMAKRQSLELIPLTKLRHTGILAENNVLMTHTMHTCTIKGRFI